MTLKIEKKGIEFNKDLNRDASSAEAKYKTNTENTEGSEGHGEKKEFMEKERTKSDKPQNAQKARKQKSEVREFPIDNC